MASLAQLKSFDVLWQLVVAAAPIQLEQQGLS